MIHSQHWCCVCVGLQVLYDTQPALVLCLRRVTSAIWYAKPALVPCVFRIIMIYDTLTRHWCWVFVGLCADFVSYTVSGAWLSVQLSCMVQLYRHIEQVDANFTKELSILTHCDAILWHRSSRWSTSAQVMAYCLTAPGHYLNQCLNHQ